MGNACAAEADVTGRVAFIDTTDGIARQRSNCCIADGEDVDPFEYQRYEAACDKYDSQSRDPSCHLPWAVAVRAAAGVQPLSRSALSRPEPEEGSIVRRAGSRRHRPPAEEANVGELVSVHLYDLSDALANLNAVSVDLMGFGGALHVGLEVFGVEWSFGTGGVSSSQPKQNRHYNYRQTVSMGRTFLSAEEVDRLINDMAREWPGSRYELWSKNCGTFCNELAERLGVGSLPEWTTRLAEAGGQSSTVRRIADLIQRNGLMGEAASPCSQSQPDLSPSGASRRSGSDGWSTASASPPAQRNEEELMWDPVLQGDDWLEEDITSEFSSSPLATGRVPKLPASRARAGELAGSAGSVARSSSQTRHASGTVRALVFAEGCQKQKALDTKSAKRMLLDPCAGSIRVRSISQTRSIAYATAGGGG